MYPGRGRVRCGPKRPCFPVDRNFAAFNVKVGRRSRPTPFHFFSMPPHHAWVAAGVGARIRGVLRANKIASDFVRAAVIAELESRDADLVTDPCEATERFSV